MKEEGKVTVNWRTDLGTMKRGVFKVGPVSTRIVNLRTGEVMPLRKDGGMFILDMWIWVPTSRTKTESCSDFARQR